MAAFIQEMAAAVCRGYRFGRTAVPQLWYADDSVFMCEDLAGVQLAADALWVVTRVAGLQAAIKERDFETSTHARLLNLVAVAPSQRCAARRAGRGTRTRTITRRRRTLTSFTGRSAADWASLRHPGLSAPQVAALPPDRQYRYQIERAELELTVNKAMTPRNHLQ